MYTFLECCFAQNLYSFTRSLTLTDINRHLFLAIFNLYVKCYSHFYILYSWSFFLFFNSFNKIVLANFIIKIIVTYFAYFSYYHIIKIYLVLSFSFAFSFVMLFVNWFDYFVSIYFDMFYLTSSQFIPVNTFRLLINKHSFSLTRFNLKITIYSSFTCFLFSLSIFIMIFFFFYFVFFIILSSSQFLVLFSFSFSVSYLFLFILLISSASFLFSFSYFLYFPCYFSLFTFSFFLFTSFLFSADVCPPLSSFGLIRSHFNYINKLHPLTLYPHLASFNMYYISHYYFPPFPPNRSAFTSINKNLFPYNLARSFTCILPLNTFRSLFPRILLVTLDYFDKFISLSLQLFYLFTYAIYYFYINISSSFLPLFTHLLYLIYMSP